MIEIYTSLNNRDVVNEVMAVMMIIVAFFSYQGVEISSQLKVSFITV